jgi:hypothetical protein
MIERFTDARDELVAAVTRNAYGALVLNTASIMFIDVDFPPIAPTEYLRHFLAKLFGRSSRSPETQCESLAWSRFEQYVGDRPHWGFRVYRTCAGLRALATHDLFDPASDTTLATLESLGTDPLYVRLCRAQQCFRARLTPKPWRCGHYGNNVLWPRETADRQRQFDEWLAGYKSRQSRYATCRLLGTLGNTAIHPEVERIIEIHDTVTRCNEPCELA